MNDIKRLIYNFEKIFLWNKAQSSSLLTSLQFAPGTPEHEAFGESEPSAVDQKLPLSSGTDVPISTSCDSDAGVQCSVCGVSLDGREEQLLHYATPYHQHNQERLLRGLQRLTLDQFNSQTHTPDDSSLSESEEEEENSCSESDQDEHGGNDDDSRESPTRISPRGGRKPRLYFLNTATGCVVSVYRTLLLPKKAVHECGEALLKATADLPTRLQWCFLMQSGGHFAGAVFRGSEAVVHKTFHSYTVRAGQGKSQGSYDNSCGSGHPRSAGASLRRYNEASHKQHVQEILEEWRELVGECDLIFTRVSRRNQSLLLGSGKACFIDPRDPRLRTIPFPTRKPTFAEIKRVHRLLAEVRIHGPVETFLAEVGEELVPGDEGGCGRPLDLQKRERVRRSSKTADECSRSNSSSSSSSGGRSSSEAPTPQLHDGVASNVQCFQSFVEADAPHARPKKKKAKKKKKQKFNTNQEYLAQNLQDAIEEQNMQSSMERVRDEVYTCCRIGDLRRLQALVVFCQSGDVSHASNFSTAVVSCVERYRDRFSVLALTMTDASKTALHIATEYNRHDLVKWLLEEGGCDPSVQDKRHRPPYSYCTTNATKMVYRRYRATHPNAHNYAKSSIPPPVSPEEEKRRNQEKEAKRIAQKARQRENKLKKQRLLEEQRERERYLNLSDREKRALAAERRLLATHESDNSRPVLLRCFQCATDISGLVPFEYSDNQFCSTTCVRRHRDDNRTGR